MELKRPLSFFFALVVTWAVPAGLLRADDDVEAIQLPMSKELAYYTFIEQSGRVQVVVSGQLAGLEAHDASEKFVVLQVAVAVAGAGPELQVTRRNFQLHDAFGETHDTVDQSDVAKTGMNSFVDSWVRTNPLNTGNRFSTFQPIASSMYPELPSSDVQAFLDRETFLVDVVYFPKPRDLHGELMLSFYTAGMQEGPVNVRFKVPQTKAKQKKKKKRKKEKKS